MFCCRSPPPPPPLRNGAQLLSSFLCSGSFVCLGSGQFSRHTAGLCVCSAVPHSHTFHILLFHLNIFFFSPTSSHTKTLIGAADVEMKDECFIVWAHGRFQCLSQNLLPEDRKTSFWMRFLWFSFHLSHYEVIIIIYSVIFTTLPQV